MAAPSSKRERASKDRARSPKRPDRSRTEIAGAARPDDKRRRAFSPARTPGTLVTKGARDLTDALVHALESASEQHEIAESLTHPIHAYPARMHPATARHLVQVVLGGTLQRGQSGRLLDPFCGSGTVLVEGRYAGLETVGVDANPLAVSIARAKTWTQSPARLRELARVGHEIAQSAIAEGKAARRSGYEAPEERAPRGVDPAVRNRYLQHWFAPHVRRELEHMAARIDDARARDRSLAEILTVLLSSILYKVSRRASDTDDTRVDRRVGRGAAARLLHERTDRLIAGLSELGQTQGGTPERRVLPGQVYRGDARALRELGLAPGSVDAVITSPPYAGTYEYAEHQQLRLVFLGMDSSAFRAAEMGSRAHFEGETGEMRRRARRRYTRALAAALHEMASVCRERALVALMLGDSVAGDTAMWAEEVMEKAVPEAFEILAFAGQARPKLGAREREAFGERAKREYLFVLHRKPEAPEEG